MDGVTCGGVSWETSEQLLILGRQITQAPTRLRIAALLVLLQREAAPVSTLQHTSDKGFHTVCVCVCACVRALQAQRGAGSRALRDPKGLAG